MLNQLYQFSPLQDTFSSSSWRWSTASRGRCRSRRCWRSSCGIGLTVIRRRTQFLLAKARQRKHTVEGLLLAHANIDEIIRVIRSSATQAEAKARLDGRSKCPAAMMQRALGDDGFAVFQHERGVARSLHAHRRAGRRHPADDARPVGQSGAGKARRRASRSCSRKSPSTCGFCPTSRTSSASSATTCRELKRKYGDERRTEISGEEIGDDRPRRPDHRRDDGRLDQPQRLHQAHAGQHLPAQRRGGKGIKGAKTDEEDPIEHLFVASTHDYLLFFTNKGKVYWQKVYDLPQLSRESRGRAVVNLLNLAEGEKIADCRAVRDFDQPDHYLMMATRKGLVKKTRARSLQPAACKSGIIAIKLKEDDELIDVRDHQAGRRDRAVDRHAAWRSASAKPTPARWAATPAA